MRWTTAFVMSTLIFSMSILAALFIVRREIPKYLIIQVAELSLRVNALEDQDQQFTANLHMVKRIKNFQQSLTVSMKRKACKAMGGQ